MALDKIDHALLLALQKTGAPVSQTWPRPLVSLKHHARAASSGSRPKGTLTAIARYCRGLH
jgi:hypothetical protein